MPEVTTTTSSTNIEPIQILVAVLCVLATIVLFIILRSKGSTSSSATGSLFGGSSRSTLVLCGPPGGGKTTLFQALIHPEQQSRKLTQTSMSVNAGWIAPLPAAMKQQLAASNNSTSTQDEFVDPNPSNKRFEVVDCPGHMRLFDLSLEAFKTAKVICIVVDGTKVQDSQNGAGSVATLLMNLMTAKETAGVSSILVACNKRDELTSFTAKALQKYVEKEMKQRLSQKAAEVGAARGGGPNLKKSETLSLDEQTGEFDWGTAPRSVSFCDISAINPQGKFGLGCLFEAM